MKTEKVKSNNKLKIAVIVLAIALIAAVGGIFGVYAATQQNVNTSFSVQYSIGKNVAVAIGAKTGNSSTMVQTGAFDWIWFEADTDLNKNSETNLYEIGVNDSDQDLNLQLPESYNGVVNLSGTTETQAFMFYFQNLSDSNITVTVADNSTLVGEIEAKMFYDPTQNTNGNPYAGTVVKYNEPITLEPGVLYEFLMFVNLKDGSDGNQSASYTSDENGGLSFKFEQA